MAIQSVYTSSDPDHRAKLDAQQAEWDLVKPLRAAFKAEHPHWDLIETGEGVVCGIETYDHPNAWGDVKDKPGFDPPDMTMWKHYKRDSSGQYVLRAKRTPAGEEMARRLRELSCSRRVEFIGMPPHAGFFQRPGYRMLDDGTVWLVWGVPAESIEKDTRFDPKIWTRRKLSEYYAMLEAQPADDNEDCDAES